MVDRVPDGPEAPAVDAPAVVEATEPTAGEPNAGGRAPDGDPRRCTAHNRRGERCGRWAAPGKSVCKNHGSRSTGPRTAAGRLRSVAANVKHGGRAKSDPYLAALRSAHPDLFDSAGGKPDLSRELAYARARLASLALLGDAADPLLVAGVLDAVRRLADAQARMMESDAARARDVAMGPTDPPPAWKMTYEVINGPVASAAGVPRPVGLADSCVAPGETRTIKPAGPY